MGSEDTNDGIVVLVTGSQALATTLASHWVFWPTGLPDFLGIRGEIERVAPVLLAGVMVIRLAALFIRRRLWRPGKAGPARPAGAWRILGG